MKHLLILIAAILLLGILFAVIFALSNDVPAGAASGTQPAPSPTAQGRAVLLPSRDNQSRNNSGSIAACSFVVVRDCNGNETVVQFGALPTLTPQPTSSPTPTAPPTNTPRPSATAVQPSATPFPTNTPFATPTQDSAVIQCVTAQPSLRVRSGPGTTFDVLGTLPTGATVTVTGTAGGWSQIDWQGRQAWVASAYLAACRTATGWHTTIPGIDYTDLETSLNILKANGHTVAVKAVDDLRSALMARDRGGYAVFRTVSAGDSPDQTLEPAVAALARYNSQRTFLPPPSAGIWIEPDNETGLIRNVEWADVYLSEIIRLYSEAGYTVVFGTEGPGWWDEGQVRALDQTWAAARQYHACLGYHAYGVTKDAPVSTSGIWLGYRHRLIHRWLIDAGYGDIPICGTEIGTGQGDEPFSVEDFLAYNAAVQGDTYLLFTAWWTAGQWKTTTTNGHMAAAANALQ